MFPLQEKRTLRSTVAFSRHTSHLPRCFLACSGGEAKHQLGSPPQCTPRGALIGCMSVIAPINNSLSLEPNPFYLYDNASVCLRPLVGVFGGRDHFEWLHTPCSGCVTYLELLVHSGSHQLGPWLALPPKRLICVAQDLYVLYALIRLISMSGGLSNFDRSRMLQTLANEGVIKLLLHTAAGLHCMQLLRVAILTFCRDWNERAHGKLTHIARPGATTRHHSVSTKQK